MWAPFSTLHWYFHWLGEHGGRLGLHKANCGRVIRRRALPAPVSTSLSLSTIAVPIWMMQAIKIAAVMAEKILILMSSWLIRNQKLLGYGPKLSLQPGTVMSFVEANVSFYAVLSRNLRQMFAKPLMWRCLPRSIKPVAAAGNRSFSLERPFIFVNGCISWLSLDDSDSRLSYWKKL